MGAGSTDSSNKDVVINKMVELGYTSTLFDGNINYPTMLQILLGNEYNVNNLGVGGENINTIAARQGAAPMVINDDIIIKKDLKETELQPNVLLSAFDYQSTVKPLLQGSDLSVNPCYVNGVECNLGYSDNTYKIQRKNASNTDITAPKGTILLTNGMKEYYNNGIVILWCWTNGGYDGNDDLLIGKLKKIISSLKTNKIILVGVHNLNETASISQEKKLQGEFGARFFNWRLYSVKNALDDFGIEKTENDTISIGQGNIPPSLLHDEVHLNQAGYMILGYKLYELIRILGYI